MDNQNDKAMMDQIALLSFIEDLIKERKDPNITDANIAQVKEVLLKEVNDAINMHLINLLSEKDQIELDDILQRNAPDEELNQFFISKIPNLEAEIASALLNFRTVYLYKPEEQKTQDVSMPPPPPPAPVE